MALDSIRFLVFFLLVALVHQMAPSRWRWLVLVPASYLFYWSFNPAFCLLLLAVSVATYVGAILAAISDRPSNRKAWLTACLFLVLGLLALFKYSDFVAGTINTLAQGLTGTNDGLLSGLKLVLPVGISFYTFQTLSYVIDVYRGQQAPERHLGRYLAYAGFFPVLLAGPITRAGVLLPQIAEPASWNWQRVGEGMRLVLWGLFKKLMIADRLAVIVAPVFAAPDNYEGLLLLLPAVCFSLQIYYDFSGYSDMAIGFARILGYNLPDNFNRPYAARSFGEFWHRWHISLSTWFRDYLYIPLGGNRVGRPRWYANLMVTFLVSGLWHGANWTFVIWGGLHGLLLVLETASSGLRHRLLGAMQQGWPRLYGGCCLALTFALVTLAWVFFRAKNLDDALFIVINTFRGWGDFEFDDFFRLGVGRLEWAATLLAVALCEAMAWADAHGRNWALGRLALPLRWSVYYCMLASIVLLGMVDKMDFVYMRF